MHPAGASGTYRIHLKRNPAKGTGRAGVCADLAIARSGFAFSAHSAQLPHILSAENSSWRFCSGECFAWAGAVVGTDKCLQSGLRRAASGCRSGRAPGFSRGRAWRGGGLEGRGGAFAPSENKMRSWKTARMINLRLSRSFALPRSCRSDARTNAMEHTMSPPRKRRKRQTHGITNPFPCTARFRGKPAP